MVTNLLKRHRGAALLRLLHTNAMTAVTARRPCGNALNAHHQPTAVVVAHRNGGAIEPHRSRLSDVKSVLRAIGSHENWLVVLGAKLARVTRKAPPTSVMPGVQPSTVIASTSTERSTVNPAREMTKASHFCVPSTSFAEQSFLKKLNETGHSPRNDVAGTIL